MVRLRHEGQYHASLGRESTSLCLTYAPAFLPPLGSLCAAHWTTFLNSLRRRVHRRGGPGFSFDVVGEMSPPPALRPHYHAALFGYWPPDAKRCGESRAGNPEFQSDEIDELWGKGRATFQQWTHGAASYISGHNSAKLMSRKLDLWVRDSEGRVLGKREPEFHRCSTRPGIGRRGFEQHGEQMLRLGFTVAGDKPVALPSYYMRRAKVSFPELAAELAIIRAAKAIELRDRDGPPLASIEFCAEEKIRRGSRKHGL
jgi:hypothetical protein